MDELNLSLCQLDNQGNNTTVWLAGNFSTLSIDRETITLKDNYPYAQTHNSLLATTCDQLVRDSTRLDNT